MFIHAFQRWYFIKNWSVLSNFEKKKVTLFCVVVARHLTITRLARMAVFENLTFPLVVNLIAWTQHIFRILVVLTFLF